MKELFFGILFIVIVGLGGLVYRNAVEHPNQPIACPMDAKLCPDGSAVARTGTACVFAECPFPNISLAEAGILFALPKGFASTTVSDPTILVAYTAQTASTTVASIMIRRYAVDASTTPAAVIQQTAINSASGMRVAATAVSSSELGNRRYTVASIERFEGVVDTAYYLARGTDVLRFDAIDTGVTRWTDPALDVTTLPAHVALAKLLASLQVL